MLTINNPDDAEKRQNVKPLTVEEEDTAIKYFNFNFHVYTRHMSEPGMVLLQRLIWLYENYRYFFEVVGGWDGLNKLQEDNDKLSDYINTLYYHNEIHKNAEQILQDK